MRNTQTSLPIFPKKSQSFLYRNLPKPQMKDKKICRFALRSALRTRKRRKAEKVSWREHRIHKAASWIDLQNQGTIYKKNFSCAGGKHCWVFIAYLQNCLQQKGDVSKHLKKAYHEKWPFITLDEKGDTCVNSEVLSTVVKWLDWRTVNVIGKQCSRLRWFG